MKRLTQFLRRTGPWTRVTIAVLAVATGAWLAGLITEMRLIIAAVAAIALWVIWHWVSPWHPFGEKHTIPDDRVKLMRRRLFWRMRPDHMHESLRGLWWHWGRLGMRRSASYIRPSLSRWYLLWHVRAYSIWLGHAQWSYKVRAPLNQHIVIIAPPQTGKTELLSSIILRYPGPVLNTSSKPDVFRRTSGVRQLAGAIEVFNPQGLTGEATAEDEAVSVPSTIAWNLIHGSHDEKVAIRRADSFIGGTSFKDVENGSVWKGIAQGCLRALFHAAGLVEHGNLNMVVAWALGADGSLLAENILKQAGKIQMAAELALIHGPDEKANASVRKILAQCLQFMTDPQLAAAVLPADGVGFDPLMFLSSGDGPRPVANTLYMIADTHDDDSPLAPLFACMANEIHYIAVRLADKQGGKLRNPFLMALDEVAQIVPVPVQVWMADSGGRNIQIIVVAHGEAQLRDRWDEAGARRILDGATVKIFLPKGSDPATLTMISKLCGNGYYWTPGGNDNKSKEAVMEDDMIRSLPPGRGLIVREDLHLLVARMASVRRDPLYLKAQRHGYVTARDLVPARTAAALGQRAEIATDGRPAIAPVRRQFPVIPETTEPDVEVVVPDYVDDAMRPLRDWESPAHRQAKKDGS